MFKITRSTLVGPLLVLGLLGCESIESTDLLTSGVYADIEATADGSGSTAVKVNLKAGPASNTFLDLTGDDKLNATQSDVVKELTRHNNGFDYIWYENSFDTDAEGSNFTVAFERSIDDGAPNSSVSLPAPFSITSPTADDTLSRDGGALTITWEPSGSENDMEISISGDCVTLFTEDLSGDPGTFTLNAGTLSDSNSSDDDDGTNCPLTILVKRKKGGTLDPSYGEGGKISGIQKRSIEIMSTP